MDGGTPLGQGPPADLLTRCRVDNLNGELSLAFHSEHTGQVGAICTERHVIYHRTDGWRRETLAISKVRTPGVQAVHDKNITTFGIKAQTAVDHAFFLKTRDRCSFRHVSYRQGGSVDIGTGVVT